MSHFILRVLTRRKIVLETKAAAVLIPGSEGDFEVLGNHAPLVSALRPGQVTAACDDGRRLIEVRGGFAVVTPDRVDILADQAHLKPG
ncbi:MAG: ATP synthase F1 subunit epsilon [Betaproteobacteria bacterium]